MFIPPALPSSTKPRRYPWNSHTVCTPASWKVHIMWVPAIQVWRSGRLNRLLKHSYRLTCQESSSLPGRYWQVGWLGRLEEVQDSRRVGRSINFLLSWPTASAVSLGMPQVLSALVCLSRLSNLPMTPGRLVREEQGSEGKSWTEAQFKISLRCVQAGASVEFVRSWGERREAWTLACSSLSLSWSFYASGYWVLDSISLALACMSSLFLIVRDGVWCISCSPGEGWRKCYFLFAWTAFFPFREPVGRFKGMCACLLGQSFTGNDGKACV